MNRKWILAIILLIAVLLRLYRLGEVPRGLHADEASFMINTVSIMETMRDEDNTFLPVYLHSIKDTKPALFSYLQIPGFVILGPTVFASRLPSVAMGVVSIYLAYLLVKEVSGNRRWALLTATLLAVSPWHIMNSRSTQEVIMSFMFAMATLLIFSRLYRELFIKKEKLAFRRQGFRLVVFALMSLMAMYSYHSAKIFLLLIIGAILAITFLQKPGKKTLLPILAIAIATLIPFLLTASSAVVRFGAVGILSDDLPMAMIHEYTSRATGKTPLFMLRALFNKPVFYVRHFLQQYLDHFSGGFFFLDGGKTARHLIPSVGVMHIIEMLAVFVGLCCFAIDKKLRKLLPLWLLVLAISPLAAALTLEDIPSSTRAFFMVLPLTFIAAVGIDWIISHRTILNKFLVAVLIAGYGWSLVFFIHQFFVIMPIYQPWHRSRDYEIAAEIIAENEQIFDKVSISDDLREMYIYLWMNDKISLSRIREQPLARYENTYSIGKYTFSRNHCDFPDRQGATLMVGSLKCPKNLEDDNLFTLEPSRFDDGVPAFAMMTNPEATISGKLDHLIPKKAKLHEPE
jgi:4-amino-4-deoxy-L-arabinose transferase-like glycosyltransferase